MASDRRMCNKRLTRALWPMPRLPAREAMEFDVVIVGAGPAGLAAAIRLKQLSPDLAVVVVEKGSEVGAHILSGAVIDPIGLDRLLPDWRTEDTPIKTAVTDDRFYWLGAAGGAAAAELPDAAADEQPRQLHRLARQRLPLARRPRPRRSASRSIRALPPPRCSIDETARSSASPPATWASARTASRKAELHPRHGAARQVHAVRRGRARPLSKQLIAQFGLADGREPQKFGIGLKELWQVAPDKHQPGPGAAHASAGRSTTRPAAARSSITSTTIWCRSASSCTSTTRTRICRRSRSSSASRPIR